MCGIVVKYYLQKEDYNVRDLPKMMQAIFHRGPDSSGSFKDERVALGFQRLSIIDTIAGQQPFYSESGNAVLIANGEIYNYKELRSHLISRGHKFNSNSDCEVILHLYEEYGVKSFERLNGMFAFCIYDLRRELLVVARDRLGIKPLYFYVSSTVVIICSEIKGIVAADDVIVQENSDVLPEYLCFRALSNRRTFFSGIYSLDPGSYLEVTSEGCRFSRYWNISIEYTSQHLETAIDRALCEAVEGQMMSDVPLGTQLSGGVDSSLVSMIASRYAEGMMAFTVGFREKSYDESSYAKKLANRAGMKYHEIVIDSATFASQFPTAIWFHDEPLCHANSVQMYLLCKYASEYVKVLLTGEGADELFAGYPRYQICRIGDRILRLGPWMANLARRGLGMVPNRKARKLASQLGRERRDLIIWNAAFADRRKVAWLLDLDDVVIHEREELLSRDLNDGVAFLDNLLIYEQKAYLQPILVRQDKMSMAASVESRVPMLDNQMLTLANNIPFSSKVRGLSMKYLLKQVALRHIPRSIVHKKKVGFGVPISSWLRDRKGLGVYLDMLLDVSKRNSCLNSRKIELLVAQHRSLERDHEDVLWPLVNYVVWQEKFLSGTS